MSFESSKFESGVSNAVSAIDKLKAALHFPNAGKGLDDINAASKTSKSLVTSVALSKISRIVWALFVLLLSPFSPLSLNRLSLRVLDLQSLSPLGRS
jgi:hypothetical protein